MTWRAAALGLLACIVAAPPSAHAEPRLARAIAPAVAAVDIDENLGGRSPADG